MLQRRTNGQRFPVFCPTFHYFSSNFFAIKAIVALFFLKMLVALNFNKSIALRIILYIPIISSCYISKACARKL